MTTTNDITKASGGIAHFFFIIEILFRIYIKICVPIVNKKKLCVTAQGVNGEPKVAKLYASGGINIAKSIEGRSMKLSTLVDYMYMYMCAVTNAYLCN